MLSSEKENPIAHEAMDIIDAIRMPSLGLKTKIYNVTLSEPEINAIHAVVAYAEATCKELERLSKREHAWWKHYGPTLKEFSERLGELDD